MLAYILGTSLVSGGMAFWLIFRVLVFGIRSLQCLNHIYPTDIYELLHHLVHSVIAGVPQGAIWSPPLFNLNISLLPTVVKYSLIVGYAGDHSLLKIIPDKTD